MLLREILNSAFFKIVLLYFLHTVHPWTHMRKRGEYWVYLTKFHIKNGLFQGFSQWCLYYLTRKISWITEVHATH